jgi:hypothetical protein
MLELDIAANQDRLNPLDHRPRIDNRGHATCTDVFNQPLIRTYKPEQENAYIISVQDKNKFLIALLQILYGVGFAVRK